jgi:spermidine synthase
MLPWNIVEAAKAPDGTQLLLASRGTEWEVRAGGHTLMSNRTHGSEMALARLAFEKVPDAKRVLLGGLGLGFSLRATLDLLPPDGRIVLAELSPALLRWNRERVGELAGNPLQDARVQVSVGDVCERIAEAAGCYDGILLDVDNGPLALVHETNDRLYGDAGIRRCLRSLRRGGVLTVWSAGPDERYLRRLRRAGFDATAKSVAARPGGGKRHVVFVAVKVSPMRRGSGAP